MTDLAAIRESVAAAALEYPIKKADLFGSYAEGRNRPDSDVDLLIEFLSPRVSLLTMNALKYRLEELLETRVDVVHAPLPEGCMLEVGRRVPVYGT